MTRRTVDGGPGGPFRVPDVRGLPRQRVLDALHRAIEAHPMTLLVAPAGSGKTTTMTQVVATSPRSIAWYRASSTHGRARDVLAHLGRLLGPTLGDGATEWASVDDAVAVLHGMPRGTRVLLVIDDLHELTGSPAEAVLEQLVRALPDEVRILAATRHTPGFNHPALRIAEDLVEVTEDVLRWRTWEVERLFRDYYRMRLRPEEAAQLTQRTEGWAAGLQLFHLASQHLPLARRAQLIDRLHTRPGLVRDYLAHNVLEGLTDGLRTFLVDTCVLGRLEPSLCDQLRGRGDSASHLVELEEKRLFLVPREDGLGHRYHEVLRTHLEVVLLERDGAVSTRARFRRAGRLLEADGALPEALHAYTRAEAWNDVARLLGSDGPSLANGGSAVLDALPASLVQADPWLRLAQARALVAQGHLGPAIAAYRDAEAAFGQGPAPQVARDERAAVHPWVEPRERPVRTRTDRLRAAVRRDPRRWANDILADSTPAALLAGSVALLLAGCADESRNTARRAGSHPDAEVFTMAAARAVEHVAQLSAGSTPDPQELLWAAETLEHVGAPWIARLVRTIAMCHSPAGLEESRATCELIDDQADPWGPPVLRLAMGIASVVHDRPEPEWLDEAAGAFRRLGAGTLEAWARSWEALARAHLGEPEPVVAAEQARVQARSMQVPGAESVAELAIVVSGGGHVEGAMARATALATELGLALPPATTAPSPARIEVRTTSSHVSCFGGLEVAVGGHWVDHTALKPQSRALLAVLAMRADSPIHRDHLIDILWPDQAPATARRRLPVLISTVRRHLEPDTEPGRWSVLLRRGEAYLLQTPPDTYVDVRALEHASAAARTARARAAREEEMAEHRRVLAAYRGELLPEFGPVEWLVQEREHYRVKVVRSAQTLAAWHLSRGELVACIETARAGLRVDRYRSQLWTQLAEAHRAAGDLAAAVRAEEEHRAVLDELGVTRPCCPSLVDVTTPSGTRGS